MIKPMITIISVITQLLALPSCMLIGPNYERPKLALPEIALVILAP